MTLFYFCEADLTELCGYREIVHDVIHYYPEQHILKSFISPALQSLANNCSLNLLMNDILLFNSL